MPSTRSSGPLLRLVAPAFALMLAGVVGVSMLLGAGGSGVVANCVTAAAARPAQPVLYAPGSGAVVGATEYGGPGDPSSGTVGSSGADLLAEPDSYAELGGTTFATARAMGGLPYGTPLRITWGGHSVIAYKRDIGLGGGPIDGHPRAIDLWWELAGRLGIPYDHGLWSGLVRVARPPATGAAALLGALPVSSPDAATSACAATGVPADAVALTSGPRARLLPDGLAAAPRDAPAAVRGIIAAGDQIVGRPYLYGGGHGLPLDQLAAAYDCSSSVDHLLYGGGLLPVSADLTSGELASWGRPGPGRWVTIYANAGHVFMYVAGLRWDTYNAAGPGDGTTGIGWHPLVRGSTGFVVRHPAGL